MFPKQKKGDNQTRFWSIPKSEKKKDFGLFKNLYIKKKNYANAHVNIQLQSDFVPRSNCFFFKE